MSIQEAYRLYREQGLYVNRKYQRKLVWTEPEKAKLIESALRGFPIPLILLAERPASEGIGKYEIVDGVQRLNALFSFIENAFPLNGNYFDLKEFARAQQFADSGAFISADQSAPKLSREDCSNFLDYQLAVTIYKAADEREVTDVFGRINSGGKQLSDQEKRQAGILAPFATLVRQLAAEIRGDASTELLLLIDMPEISIDSKRARQNYGLTAEETFWCKLGILRNSDLRDGEDEEIVSDLVASILLGGPINRSRETLDEIYNPISEMFEKVETALATYSDAKIRREMKGTFSILRETIELYSTEKNALRLLVNPGSGNPISAAFYAIYMSFFDLTVTKQLSPSDPKAIAVALRNLQSKLVRSAHYAKAEDRRKNIDLATGLIQRFFVKKEPPVLTHGPGLAIDFENSLRRSSVETGRYEFKQGFLRLSDKREFDMELLNRIPEIVCGIANVGPHSNGYIYIGVADKETDAKKVEVMDGVSLMKIGQRFVVGIEREVKILNSTVDKYIEKLVGALRASSLSEPLKTQTLVEIDVIEYRGRSVIRLVVPKQRDISFLGDSAFSRQGSQTVRVEGKQLLALQNQFRAK
jgi:hypothetical protein